MNAKQFIDWLWDNYGILVKEEAEYQGFIKRKVDYIAKIPDVDIIHGVVYGKDTIKVSLGKAKEMQRNFKRWAKEHEKELLLIKEYKKKIDEGCS